jgi:hypothetical protein
MKNRIKLPRSKRRLSVLTRKLATATRSNNHAVKRLKVLFREDARRKRAVDRELDAVAGRFVVARRPGAGCGPRLVF